MFNAYIDIYFKYFMLSSILCSKIYWTCIMYIFILYTKLIHYLSLLFTHIIVIHMYSLMYVFDTFDT